MSKKSDALYESIGGMATCQRLSERFHDRVAIDPVLREIFPKNLVPATDRLAWFLAERLGGPAEYTSRRGKQSLQCRHAHLPISTAEVEAWLHHMFAVMEEVELPEAAQQHLRSFFTDTAGTVADPFIHFYTLPLDELQALLEKDRALASASDRERSLLSEAAGRWDAPRVRMLLNYGADVLLKEQGDQRPLYRAAGALSPGPEDAGCEVIALLIQHGADVNGRYGVGRMTPLHMAARRDNAAIAAVLLGAGAEIDAVDTKGETPLRRAVNCRQEGVVRLLLSRGADPHTQDKLGCSALMACRHDGIRQLLETAMAAQSTEQIVPGVS